MGLGFAPWSLIFLVSLVLLCVQSSIAARDLAEGQWIDAGREEHDLQEHAMDDQIWIDAKQGGHGHRTMGAKHEEKQVQILQQNPIDDHQRNYAKQDDIVDDGHQGMHAEHVHDHPSSHMDHMDPSARIFFTINDLKVGKIMPIYLPYKDPSNSPHMLPKEEADSIPFSLTHLSYLLEFFSFPQGSYQAKAMEDTLNSCGLEAIKGETKFCATSLESMLDFTRGVLGLDTHLKVLTTKIPTKPAKNLQNYTVLEVPKEILAPKMVACHAMPYPYAVFYCHCQESENKLFEVSLGGEDGERVEAVAICHMDTSHWDHDHAAFRVLAIQPGSSPVCHFFPADNLVWVPSPALI
ncbi:hypothetical protein L1049_014968 [Liquidambar formosana]|uniref:BURP domain-containing protein n=1 Tax=Liquidambar formosana TaxID=63359 RepID=A0AAP0WZD6_LIQFO